MTGRLSDPDGRQWTLSNTVSWRLPAGADGFEREFASGRRSGALLVVLLLFLVLLLMAWRPSSVVVPDWLLALIVIAALFPVARWLVHRPWTLVAETAGDTVAGNYAQRPAERWVGTVWGPRRAWWAFWKIRHSIRRHSSPETGGLLRHVE